MPRASVRQPMNIEDHGDFVGAGIAPGMRFRIETACSVIEDAEFCGLMSEQGPTGLVHVGMRFRVNGDTTLSLRWTEIDRLVAAG